MRKAVSLTCHLLSDLGPDNTLQRTLIDDSEEQVLVRLVVPLRRHGCLMRGPDLRCLSNTALCRWLVVQMGCFEWEREEVDKFEIEADGLRL